MDAAGNDDPQIPERPNVSDVTISRSSLAASELPVYVGVAMDRITLVDDAALASRADRCSQGRTGRSDACAGRRVRRAQH